MSRDLRLEPSAYLTALRADVRAGLSAEPKTLPPKYFYDARGSELFDEITRLPEYYPTRAEAAVLAERADDIARLSQARTLVELGSGTSTKTGCCCARSPTPGPLSASSRSTSIRSCSARRPR